MDQNCLTIETLLPREIVNMDEIRQWFTDFPLPISSYVLIPEEPYILRLRVLYIESQDGIQIPNEHKRIPVLNYPSGDFQMFMLPKGVKVKGKFAMIRYGNHEFFCTVYLHAACTVFLEVPKEMRKIVDYITVTLEE